MLLDDSLEKIEKDIAKDVINIQAKEDYQDKGLYTLIVEPDKFELNIGYSSIIGKRKDNQDSIVCDSDYYYKENNRAIAVLCDGMGGLSNGQLASSICARNMVEAFHTIGSNDDIKIFYKTMINELDKVVCDLTDEEGNSIHAGTTLASVVIHENKLYWASVGDSRIYIIRNNKIHCITKDHNYGMILEEKYKKGLISKEDINNAEKKEALVSFIGIDGIKYIDINCNDFILEDNDYIVLCSDGLYRALTEDEIRVIVSESLYDMNKAAEKLTLYSTEKDILFQDNTSVIVIRFCEN